MNTNRTVGIAFMIVTMAIFSIQDGLSKLLALDYPPIFIVMIRFWAFAAFVLALAQVKFGGPKAAARTKRPAIQFLRGAMLVFQIVLMTYSFAALGLAETHAIMGAYPLIIAAMAAIFLGEKVSLSQWVAIGAGFIGVLVLLQPGTHVFDVKALIPLFCACVFATYSILTRWVGRTDAPSVSFFYTGIGGAVCISLIGPFFWTEMLATDWIWMILLCITGATGHFCLIKAYEHAPAADLQPFAYLQLILSSVIGVLAFREEIDVPLILGTAIVVAAGLFALLKGKRVIATPAPKPVE